MEPLHVALIEPAALTDGVMNDQSKPPVEPPARGRCVHGRCPSACPSSHNGVQCNQSALSSSQAAAKWIDKHFAAVEGPLLKPDIQFIIGNNLAGLLLGTSTRPTLNNRPASAVTHNHSSNIYVMFRYCSDRVIPRLFSNIGSSASMSHSRPYVQSAPASA